MTKLYQERYSIFSIETRYSAMNNPPSLNVMVTLEKEGKRITVQSTEQDFIKYAVGLRGIVDVSGNYKFKNLKDSDQYVADTLYLIDEDRSKITKAVEEITSGKFTLKYSPSKLIDEFLKNGKNVKNAKYLPLKNDYHHILAAALIESKTMWKAREIIIKRSPEMQKVVDAIEIISLKSFRPMGNALKDYKFYKKYFNFDINSLGDRMSGELVVTNDTLKIFKNRGAIDASIAIPRMMTIYSHLLEILAPMINLIRIGLELKQNNPTPAKNYSIGKNIKILKSDIEYGSLFSCLDDQIRHSDAHSSKRIDKEKGQVLLIDARSGVEKIKRIYTFDELTNMINTMQNEFFPAIYPTIIMIDITMRDLLLISREYKFLLLGLGNI